MNQLGLWHADTGDVMLKVVCKLLVGYDHKLPWPIKFLRFSNQLFLKSNPINQCDFLHAEID